MAEFQHPVQPGYFTQKQVDTHEVGFVPYWARSHVQYAQNLLECSDEPIEYDHEDEDYQDNCFFFPEDCSWSPPKDWAIDDNSETETDSTTEGSRTESDYETENDIYTYDDDMIPGLPDIKMLDAEALSDLLEDNLSPPEITSMMVFATNGAVFAHASSLPSRQLRNLSATYGAAYTCYAKTVSSGNLTGVNPASHPSSYITAQSVSLGDVGSIVFELDDSVAVVTRIADKVLLAAIGPSKLPQPQTDDINDDGLIRNGSSNNLHTADTATPDNNNNTTTNADALTVNLETQYQIDRSSDLARLESLNLSASPAILLALESKSAALGKFLGQKLADLESPDDF
ncbi:hypothetical protein SI65_07146 [Aspergillus cristatus]|uniref:Uncharacterized protein n=1 Tax=Aspergillus cristatus TaxID=573508 RepID=A0A1E3B9J5_ASPCR|nr:hypothetical protein SI65_07146 [Aspergillus cristatus]